MATQSIILFDGICNLCNAAVQFVIKRDKKNQFLFASLQSETGHKLIKSHELDNAAPQSFVLIENGKVYQRSEAALRVVKKLNGAWSLFYGFIILPAFFRDGIYNFISRKRYKWFGRQDECVLPAPELKAKFLN